MATRTSRASGTRAIRASGRRSRSSIKVILPLEGVNQDKDNVSRRSIAFPLQSARRPQTSRPYKPELAREGEGSGGSPEPGRPGVLLQAGRRAAHGRRRRRSSRCRTRSCSCTRRISSASSRSAPRTAPISTRPIWAIRSRSGRATRSSSTSTTSTTTRGLARTATSTPRRCTSSSGSRRNGDALNYQVTVEDPNVFTKPWIMNPRTLRLGNRPLEEGPPCVEKDAEHLVTLDHH